MRKPTRKRLLLPMTFAAAASAIALAASPASAASSWEVVINNGHIGSGTGSVKLAFPPSGGSTCVAINSSGAYTHFSPSTHANAGVDFTIQAFGDAKCSGATTGSLLEFNLAADSDVGDTGLNCTQVAVRPDGSGGAEWINCR